MGSPGGRWGQGAKLPGGGGLRQSFRCVGVAHLTCHYLPISAPFRICTLMTDTNWPNLHERDFIIRDFRFLSGETLPELRQHYLTFGTPKTDAGGRISNAVLLIHNTTGTAKTWLEPALADELFAPGQPLDAERYFMIIPDIIGFGFPASR